MIKLDHADIYKGNKSIVGPMAILALATVVAYVWPEEHGPSTDDRGRRPSGAAAQSEETDHGRAANSPVEVPARGWKDVLWRTYEQVGDDRLLAVAAGVVFYGLLAFFPAITALVSSYALFADPQTINEHMSFIGNVLPAGGYSIVQDQVGRVLAKGGTKLGFAFGLSLLLAIWSANGGMKAIIDALNVVYDEKEKRGFIALNTVSLAFTLGGLVAILAAIGLVVAAPLAMSSLGLGRLGDLLLQYGRWPALAVMVLIGLAVLYRFAPSRSTPKWKWVSVGSLLAAVAWLLGSAALSYYLANFAGYDATYGSLGAAIGLMMWMWMSTIVVLFGAELNSEIEHQTAKDSTDGSSKPMGGRGAAVADTIGSAR
jgi:membrane protein